MDKYHRDIVHKRVKEAAKQIDGLLPISPSHPNGRIPVAHIYQVIQTVMGCPARECDTSRIHDIMLIIQDCVDMVDVYDVSSAITHKYCPQKSPTPTHTLESFFH